MAVDIVVEAHRPLLVGKYRRIEDVNRHGVLQGNGFRLTAIHSRLDSFARPLALVRQDEFRKTHRVFHPNAAMAEVASGLLEQSLRWRTVQVDVVMVWKCKLDQTQS